MEFLKENRLEKEYKATFANYIRLIERDYRLLREHVEDCESVCVELMKKKEAMNLKGVVYGISKNKR